MKSVAKTYGHECGLSATFRQWRAKSHCHFIHGYALAFKLAFVCADDEVDENGWVINFGGLKPVKQWLEQTFDHVTLVAVDDPLLSVFQEIQFQGLIQLVIVNGTGCEAFAEMVYEKVNLMLLEGKLGETKAQLVHVEVKEHGSNAAGYSPGPSRRGQA